MVFYHSIASTARNIGQLNGGTSAHAGLSNGVADFGNDLSAFASVIVTRIEVDHAFGKRGGFGYNDWFVIAESAAPERRMKEFVVNRIKDNSQDSFLILDEREGDREFGQANRVIRGAVDWIQHPKIFFFVFFRCFFT